MLGRLVKSPSRSLLLKAGRPLWDDRRLVYGVINPDDMLVSWMSGGGGYGDSLERDPELVLKDVREGELTIDYAKEAYGVVVDPKTLTIDSKGTQEQRKKMIEERLKEGVK